MSLLKVRLKTNEIVLMCLIILTFFALFHFSGGNLTPLLAVQADVL